MKKLIKNGKKFGIYFMVMLFSLQPYSLYASAIFEDADGNIGIGTISPNFGTGAGKVCIVGASTAGQKATLSLIHSAPKLILQETGIGYRGVLGLDSRGSMQIMDDNSNPRITVRQNGDTGIGTINPGARLHVMGNDISSPDSQWNADDIAIFEGTNALLKLHASNEAGIDFASGNNRAQAGLRYNLSASNFYFFGGKVGIGTNNPVNALDVVGTVSAARFVGDGSGLTNLPMGTAPFTGDHFLFNPGSRERQWAAINVNSGYSATYNGLGIFSNHKSDGTQGNPAVSSWFVDIGGLDRTQGWNDEFGVYRKAAGTDNYVSLFKMDASGNMGIGTSNPTAKLDVNGTIVANEIKVALQRPVPDYVFAPNYNLMSLPQLENRIKEQRHLPGIPSAKEIDKDGLSL